MSDLSRRDFLETGVSASLAAAWGFLPSVAAGDSTRGTAERREHPQANPGSRERLSLDAGWRFALGHASDPARDFGFGQGNAFAKSGSFGGPTRVSGTGRGTFDDSQWRLLDLPHDWAVELPFIDARPVNAHGAKPIGRAYPDTSIGWYRQTFQIPAEDVGRRISIELDGVFRDSIVALNGHYIGRHLSGYSPFRFDVTDFLNYGSANTLVLRVDATESEGWFYEGAGIYRHVWLVKTNGLHVPQWGTHVVSTVNGRSATLDITTEVENASDTSASCEVLSTIGVDGAAPIVSRSPSTTIPPWSKVPIAQRIRVSSPTLWSIDNPTLYTLTTTIEGGGQEVDRYTTPFGIRTITLDPDRGLFINGAHVEVKGTCNHQDHAGVGSALPDRIQTYRIERLKAMGSNAYRTSHNPPTPELLDACDRLGMIVMDETRTMSSNPEAAADLEALVRRDRNRPSVVWWSIGNEEPEQGTERGARIATSMKRLVRSLDTTRPITAAMNGAWGHGISAVLDVQGFNYGSAQAMDDFHRAFPKQPSMGSEVASTVCTRGIYADDAQAGYVNAYDHRAPAWGATAEAWWSTYMARPWTAGGFVWTGFDYRGEPTPYGWPCISSHFGIMDTCGFPKDNFYYYQAWWGSQPALHLFPHWNWATPGQEVEVWCHTNLDRVELFVNGTRAGVQDVPRYGHAMWTVPYAPGVIEARGYRGSQQVLTDRRETTGAPAAIVLAPDRTSISSDGSDVSLVEVRIVDSAGRVVPLASNLVSFAMDGPATVVGVGNGDPSCHEPDKAAQRSAFNGLCMAIVQPHRGANGTAQLTAASPGLRSAAATIACAVPGFTIR